MKQGSTLILKLVILFLALIVLGLCIFVLPRLIITEFSGDFDYGFIFLGLYLPAIPYFIALYKAFTLLNLIDKHKAFSLKSVKALKSIKLSAFLISGLFAVQMPYVFYVADRDDAPGLAAIGFVFIGASFVIGTAAAVFQSLMQNAVDIKSENDLTV